MSDGDAHIWQPGAGNVPVAACGYQPAVNEDTGQVEHAEATGVACADCIEATEAPVVPPSFEDAFPDGDDETPE